MPELPEVQTVVNDLIAENLIGCVIVGVEIRWPKIVAEPLAYQFSELIQNRTIINISRRGKFLRIDLQPEKFLFVHLRMSGRLFLTEAGSPVSKHEHVIFSLNDGRQLRYHDTRKFGRFWLVDQPEKIVGNLGIEPLSPEFSLEALTERLRGRRRQLKPLLLDQSVIAGLGNIYVDESLWAARLHPTRLADLLNDREIKALYRAIPLVLRQGLQNQGTSLGNGKGNFQSAGKRRGRNQEVLKVFHRTGQPCPVCATKIERIIVGQRSTHFCPRCQALK
jgi:formamidopyrimidine-DNA glycosylase